MKIYFKNETSLEITEDIGEVLYKQITTGCNKFQIFTNQYGKVILILNLDEVVYIQ